MVRKARVWQWAADEAGCGTYRMRWPGDVVSKHYGDSIEIRRDTVLTKANRDWNPDVVIGQRVCLPGPSEVWQEWHRQGKVMITELDDSLWDIPQRNLKASAVFNTPGIRKRLEENIAVSDWITVTTEALKQTVIRNTGFDADRIIVIPNALPPELLIETVPEPGSRSWSLGYLASPTHGDDWKMVQRHVKRFMENNSDATFTTIGTDYGSHLKLPGRTFHRKWDSTPESAIEAIDYEMSIAPLLAGTFNRSKCLDAGTRIATDRGVLRISEIESGDRVWHNGDWKEVQATEHSDPRPGFRVTLADGYSLKMTPEHRMFVDGEYKQASEIRPGNMMHTEPESFGDVEYQTIPWPSQSRMSRREDAKHDAWMDAVDVPRLTITPRWGRFLGAFLGDGSLGSQTDVSIHCDGQDSDWIEKLVEDFREMGFDSSVYQVKQFNGTPSRGRTVRVASAMLVRVLEYLGVAEWKNETRKGARKIVRVPDVIWNSPRDVVAEFLSGYFEADGGMASSGIQAVSKDFEFIDDVQRLLVLFGIQSVTRVRKSSCQNNFSAEYKQIRIRRLPAAQFETLIGFQSKRKKESLGILTDRRWGNNTKPINWTQEVVSVESCDVNPVDLQVEGSVFSASGMVSHNSDIKQLEAAARGVPSIVSDVVAYAPVRHAETGIKVSREHEWGKAIQRLWDDPEERYRLAVNAHHDVAENRTTDVTAALWADVMTRGKAT